MRMKHTILLLVAMIVVTAPVITSAQQMELTPYVGYRWTSQVNGGTYVLDDGSELTNHDFESAVNFGLTFDIRLGNRLMLEFMGEGMPTKFQATDDSKPQRSAEIDVTFYYIHLGLMYEIIEEGINAADVKTVPFLLGSIGSTLVDGEGDVSTDARFSAAFSLGFKSFINNWFGIRVQGRYMYTYLASGNDYWCSGDGTGLGENCTVYPTATELSQIDVTLGAIFSF